MGKRMVVAAHTHEDLLVLTYQSGYHLARMPFEIVFSPEAVEDWNRLSASARSTVRAALETHLRHEPAKVSRARIKRLRGLSHPQFRLRVDDIRVFYDIEDHSVQILAIVAKSDAADWLAEKGQQDETDTTV